jgi:hypothetical protein
MLGEWLTSTFNRREDEYGGSLTNRLRIVLEIIEPCAKQSVASSSSAAASTARGRPTCCHSTKASRWPNDCTRPVRSIFST